MTGIYIHIPFCERKCPYCAFYSVVPDRDVKEKYLQRIIKDISGIDRTVKADTLYFGGGTPLLLGADGIAQIVDQCGRAFELISPEITVECNPNSTDKEALKILKSAGVDRLSVGVQSLDDGELRLLGRLHNSSQAIQTLQDANSVGFNNVSADLMIGIKGQTEERITSSVKTLKELGAKHISVYMIKVEQGTAFDTPSIRSRLTDDDETSQLYLATVNSCKAFGFEQYEISNFAVPGYESKHNLKYWRGEEYIGLGPSAHSFYKGVRSCWPSSLTDYLKDSEQIITDNSPDKAEEYVMLGLRLSKGIDFDIAAKLGIDGHKIDNAVKLAVKLQKNGLCMLDGNRMSLTPEGMLVSNSIIGAILA